MMNREAAQYVFDRIVKGRLFGGRVIDKREQPPTFQTVEEALCWLTVDCWHSNGLQEWVALHTPLLP